MTPAATKAELKQKLLEAREETFSLAAMVDDDVARPSDGVAWEKEASGERQGEVLA